MATQTSGSMRIVPAQFLLPFALVTILFPLWGFANDVTNPMVKAFSRILQMSNFEGSLVQFAFYGGYFAMAFPAALFIKRYSYKAGILVGLGLYASGALLFIPGSMMMVYWPFLVAYFILTCGLSFLETSANPYILAMGPEETATRRLNFAQSFNPMGSLMGMFVAQQFILARLDPATAAERSAMAPDQLAALTASDLAVVRTPYLGIALVITLVFLAIAITRMPAYGEEDKSLNVGPTLRRLLRSSRYVEGVIAQFFYVGAQIAVWSYIIRYVLIQMDLDAVVASLGDGATSEAIIEKLRGLEPIAAGFYNICEWVGLDALLPLSLGLLATLAEIVAMDLLRLALTQQLGLPF